MSFLLEMAGTSAGSVFYKLPFSDQASFSKVCTIRSAVRPSQRSGRVVCFHSPCIR